MPRVDAWRAGVADHSGRIAGHYRVIGNVARDDRTGSNQGPLPDHDRQEGRSTADHGSTFDKGRGKGPALGPDNPTALVDGPWRQIIGEHHAMSDENLILDGDAVRDKGVRLDL